MIAPGEPLDGEDEATVRLLRLAGGRRAVASAREERVRVAVRSHWQRDRRRRRTSRHVAAGACVVVAVAVLLTVSQRMLPTQEAVIASGDPVAIVERVDGSPRRSDGESARDEQRLHTGEAVRAGEEIQTDGESRVALRFGDALSVRLDTGSRVRLVSTGVVELLAGAVYVDSGDERDRFEVRTALAVARDIGTQFEVRLVADALRLRVRSGFVELSDRTRTVAGRAGTEITFSATHAITRPLPAFGSEWRWSTSIAPAIEMEGVSLSVFLQRVAKEQGWTVAYHDAQVAERAVGVTLHGSVERLTAEELVDVAITTSGLNSRIEHGVLHVLPSPLPANP